MSHLYCDWLIDYVNGQLTNDKREAFEKHLHECDVCQQELEELTTLTSDLPFDSEPVEPPKEMKDRVLNEVFSHEQEQVVERQEHQDVIAPSEAKASKADSLEGRKSKKVNATVYALAATLFLSVAGNVYLSTQLNQETSDTPDVVQVTPDQVIQSVTLASTDFMNAKGRAFILDNGKDQQLLVQAENLQSVEGNQAYQVWLLEGQKPYRAGTFVPGDDGSGAVVFNLEALKEVNWDTIAITLEPTPHSELPQGKILLASEI